MEKITKINLDEPSSNSPNEIGISREMLELGGDARKYASFMRMIEYSIAEKLLGIYEQDSNPNRKYNLVLLTDEELKGLEGKTK
jgi:hypothetical protein